MNIPVTGLESDISGGMPGNGSESKTDQAGVETADCSREPDSTSEIRQGKQSRSAIDAGFDGVGCSPIKKLKCTEFTTEGVGEESTTQ